MRKWIFWNLAIITLLAGCAHHRSILPDAKEVKLSREAPAKNCREIGPVNGRTLTAKGTQEEALSDLTKEAANKGANFVLIRQFSSYGTEVVGIAYECP